MNQNTKKPALMLGGAALLSFLVALVLYLQPQSRPFNWLDFEDAKKVALAENKPIFLNFYSKWDPISKNIENTVFMNDTIKTALNKGFILASMNIGSKENQKIMIEKFKIQNLPTFIILDGNGKEITRYATMPIGQEMLFYNWLTDTSYKYVINWKNYNEAKDNAAENDRFLLVVIARLPFATSSIYNVYNNKEIKESIAESIEPTFLTSTNEKDLAIIKEIGDPNSEQNEIILFDKKFIRRFSYDFYIANEDMRKWIIESISHIKSEKIEDYDKQMKE